MKAILEDGKASFVSPSCEILLHGKRLNALFGVTDDLADELKELAHDYPSGTVVRYLIVVKVLDVNDG
jgi:hypothetical protein